MLTCLNIICHSQQYFILNQFLTSIQFFPSLLVGIVTKMQGGLFCYLTILRSDFKHSDHFVDVCKYLHTYIQIGLLQHEVTVILATEERPKALVLDPY